MKHAKSTRSLVISLFVFLLLFPVGPKDCTAQEVRPKIEIKITGLEEQRYCENQADLFTVYLKLKLGVTNLSDKPVIISKSLSPVERVRVAVSLEEAESGKFVYNPVAFEVSSRKPKPIHIGATPNQEMFIVLKPGQKYEGVIWTGVLADLSKKLVLDRPGMTSGPFVVQVSVRTWPYGTVDPSSFETAQNRWKNIGDLLNDVVASNFFPINLPISPRSTPCEKFEAPQ